MYEGANGFLRSRQTELAKKIRPNRGRNQQAKRGLVPSEATCRLKKVGWIIAEPGEKSESSWIDIVPMVFSALPGIAGKGGFHMTIRWSSPNSKATFSTRRRKYYMPLNTYADWLTQQPHIPAADAVVPMIAAAGPEGIERGELGNRLKLDRATLDQLLQSLVDLRRIEARMENGKVVFRVGR